MRLIYVFSFLLFFSCNSIESPIDNNNQPKAQLVVQNDFDKYWYAGKAELSSYDLEQARYGEIHKGESVLIFVTEDFSASKQVKLDYPSKNPKDAVPIMKLNQTKKFLTGIYPYSMMTSTFTPINRKQHPHSLKVTTTSQEWCGHTFTQLNWNKNNYELNDFSYFESEGDRNQKIDNAILEDELLNLIRINPDLLPLGNVQLIPGTMSARLRHQALQATSAETTLDRKEEVAIYIINYPSEKRTLKINFQNKFPFEILGWEESYLDGFSNPQMLTTKATRKKTIQLDYWNKHDVADLKWREKLDLK